MSRSKSRTPDGRQATAEPSRRWRMAVASTALALALGVAACGGASKSEPKSDSGGASTSEQASGPIKIGMPIAKTGVMVPYDGESSEAFKMAVADINAKGGVNGRKLEVIQADTRSDIAQGRLAAAKVVNAGAQMLVVTCEFDFGSPAAAVGQQHNMVSLTLCAASAKFGVQGIGPLAYSANMAAAAEGGVLAEWAAPNVGKKGFALVDDTIAYDRDLCDGVKQRFGPSGGQIVGEDSFKNGDQSISSQISKIKSSGADVIFLCTYPPGGASAVRQIRAAGINTPIVTGVGMDGAYWVNAVPNLSNFYVSTPASVFGDDPNPAVNAFVKKFKKVTGKSPSTGLVTIGYTDAQALAKGIEQAGTTDGPKLADAMNKFTDEKFTLGSVTWTPDLHIQTNLPMAVIKWTGSKPKYEATVKLKGKVDLGLGG